MIVWRGRLGLTAALVVAALAVGLPLAPARAADPEDEALAAGREFLERYVDADGRVVRRDQGADTVSEGQAYGMLIAVALEDREAFSAIWTWTVDNIQRPDGLLSWRWVDGQVPDPAGASDADLAAAAALALAAERFDDDAYLRESQRIGRSILDKHTMVARSMLVLVPGPWAAPSRYLNVSYFMVNEMAVMGASPRWWAPPHLEWLGVAASSRTLVDELTRSAPHLPPDWSRIADDGKIAAANGPDGRVARFGYEAARTLVQLAVDCHADGRAIAARAWPYFDLLGPGGVTAEMTMDGNPIGPERHPVSLVGAAGSAQAAGRDDASDRLLDEATELDRAHPTYYGAAWIALGRLWLDTSLLGGCRTG